MMQTVRWRTFRHRIPAGARYCKPEKGAVQGGDMGGIIRSVV